MDTPYGPLKKTPWAIFIFLVPAVASIGMGYGLALQDSGSADAALSSTTFVLCTLLGAVALVWGGVFMSRPIVTLTPDAVVWPNGKTIRWADVDSMQAGQDSSTVASDTTGPRTVVHEVMRLHHGAPTPTKIVTTWAAIGPQAANDRIAAAYAQTASAQTA